MLAAGGLAACSQDMQTSSTTALRERLLDDALGDISPPLAVVEQYLRHNLEWTCKYAAVPGEGATALARSAKKGASTADAVAVYLSALDRIYGEEEAFCTAYKQAATEVEELVRVVVAEQKPPSRALYMFYAKPRGIMRDVRVSNDQLAAEDGLVSVDRGFSEGTWLGFEVAPGGELALGLFPTQSECDAVQLELSRSGVETRSCRDWSSEPVHQAHWQTRSTL